MKHHHRIMKIYTSNIPIKYKFERWPEQKLQGSCTFTNEYAKFEFKKSFFIENVIYLFCDVSLVIWISIN